MIIDSYSLHYVDPNDPDNIEGGELLTNSRQIVLAGLFAIESETIVKERHKHFLVADKGIHDRILNLTE